MHVYANLDKSSATGILESKLLAAGLETSRQVGHICFGKSGQVGGDGQSLLQSLGSWAILYKSGQVSYTRLGKSR